MSSVSYPSFSESISKPLTSPRKQMRHPPHGLRSLIKDAKPIRALRRLCQRRHRTCLECLPVSILEDIFRLVCVDGGQMAYRLALVSSNINAISRAARFHSVSLTVGKPWRLHAFMEALVRERSAAQAAGSTIPYVRHLRISIASLREAYITNLFERESLSKYPEPPKYDLTDLCNRNIGCEESEFRPSQKHLRLCVEEERRIKYLRRLLRTVAPKVETLCLFGTRSCYAWQSLYDDYSRFRGYGLHVKCFPRLRELYFSGDEPRLVRRNGKDDALTGLPVELSQSMFPVLKRLDIAVHATNTLDVRRWVVAAPALEDVRITLGLWNGAKAEPKFINPLIWVLST